MRGRKGESKDERERQQEEGQKGTQNYEQRERVKETSLMHLVFSHFG